MTWKNVCLNPNPLGLKNDVEAAAGQCSITDGILTHRRYSRSQKWKAKLIYDCLTWLPSFLSTWSYLNYMKEKMWYRTPSSSSCKNDVHLIFCCWRFRASGSSSKLPLSCLNSAACFFMVEYLKELSPSVLNKFMNRLRCHAPF